MQFDRILFEFFRQGRSLWFYSKDEATNFNANIAKCSFKYKAVLLKNTVLDEKNLILKKWLTQKQNWNLDVQSIVF